MFIFLYVYKKKLLQSLTKGSVKEPFTEALVYMGILPRTYHRYLKNILYDKIIYFSRLSSLLKEKITSTVAEQRLFKFYNVSNNIVHFSCEII